MQLLLANGGEILPENQGSDPISEEFETLRAADGENVAQHPASGRQDLRPGFGHWPGAACARYDRHIGRIPRLRRDTLLVPGALGFR